MTDVHNTALLNRAIAYLKSGKLDEAQQDYETLQKSFPTAYRIYYGLGEIAYRRKDTNAAIRNYQLYLTNSPPNPRKSISVRDRLKELRPGYPLRKPVAALINEGGRNLEIPRPKLQRSSSFREACFKFESFKFGNLLALGCWNLDVFRVCASRISSPV